MPQPRISSGIAGIDEILLGGFFTSSSYLLVGSAGTGKTVLSMQWLASGRSVGDRGLFITLAEPAHKIRQNVASFGWDLENVDIVDLTVDDDAPTADEGEYRIFPPSDVEHVPIWQGIFSAIEKHRPQRVVIDSLTQLRYLSTDEYQFRKHLLRLVTFLDRCGCTTIMAYEPVELEHEASVALAVDGILRLRMHVSQNRVIGLRNLQVEKFRGSDFMSGLHPMRIGPTGITVFPHRIETIDRTPPSTTVLSSQNAELDELLGGGIEAGTTTMLTGPPGVGKSTLSMQFAVSAAHRGTRSVVYAFEESIDSIIRRCRNVGIEIGTLIDDEMLKITPINAMQLYPDEFLALVRADVEAGFVFVSVDSLRGYMLAMEEFGTPVAHLHNLVTHLNRRGVTTIVINEVEYITGNLRATDLGVSHVADNIVLMRYAEYRSRVIKVIGCLKKRIGDFEPELRELQISSAGIRVSEKLTYLRGILTGVPALVDASLDSNGDPR
jgi:circadian clock protein KaiC